MSKFDNERNIFSLAIAATNEYHQLVRAQQVIRLCLDEDISSKEGQETILVLLECYQSWVSLHFDELQAYLHNLLLEVKRLNQD